MKSRVKIIQRILRILFLLFGTLLILAGIVCLFLGVDFGLEISGINASFLVDILAIILGMIFASKYFMARYYIRENSLTLKRMRYYTVITFLFNFALILILF